MFCFAADLFVMEALWIVKRKNLDHLLSTTSPLAYPTIVADLLGMLMTNRVCGLNADASPGPHSVANEEAQPAFWRHAGLQQAQRGHAPTVRGVLSKTEMLRLLSLRSTLEREMAEECRW